MSIRDEARKRVQEGRLCLVQPSTTLDACVRTVLVSLVVWEALHGPWSSISDEIRLARAKAQIDNFIEGRRISVRFPPSKSVLAYMALLEKPHEEVWEIRARDPKPGVRILGRFSEQDVFIGLLPVYREDLKSDRDWEIAKQRCRSEWNKLFPSHHPFSGSHPNEYISRNIFLV